MFSREERLKAVKLYIKYDFKIAPVIRELGYPSVGSLVNWYREYVNNESNMKDGYHRESKFTPEQRKKAVDYFLDHGRNYSNTSKKLGYPSRTLLAKWVKEDVPGHIFSCLEKRSLLTYSREEKEAAVIDLSTREGAAVEVMDKHGVSRASIYNWRKEILSEEGLSVMNDRKDTKELDVKDALKEVEDLKKEIAKLKLEKDILKEAVKLIKKDEGIDVTNLSNKQKAMIINTLKADYPLKKFLIALKISKSSYFYQNTVMSSLDKYSSVRMEIIKIFNENYQSYGYRRIHENLKKNGITVSEKVIRRLMKEERLVVIITSKKKFNSYLGEISPAVSNLLERNFNAERPNEKMLTDITEFSIPAGKVYLSPLIDCFDGMVSSWTLSTSPNADLVNSMLSNYVETLTTDETPIIHSDRGSHYRWPGWIKTMDDSNLIRSMSKKGCSPDNSACEGFFGRLKNEMFYNRKWADITIKEFMEHINNYIYWYNFKRIKMSLDGLSPIEYRRSLGII